MGLCGSTDTPGPKRKRRNEQLAADQVFEPADKHVAEQVQRTSQVKLPVKRINKQDSILPSTPQPISNIDRHSLQYHENILKESTNTKDSRIYEADAYAFSMADVPLSKNLRQIEESYYQKGIPRVIVSLSCSTNNSVSSTMCTQDAITSPYPDNLLHVPRVRLSLQPNIAAAAFPAASVASEGTSSKKFQECSLV